MNWKLWLMSKIALVPAENKSQGQGKPKDLPQEVGRYLVVEKGLDPDWVWGLKYVRKPEGNSKRFFTFRIFSPQDAGQKSVKISNYETLSAHPDLILFAGRHDKENREVEMD